MNKKNILTAIIGVSILFIILGGVTFYGIKNKISFFNDKDAEMMDSLKDIEQNANNQKTNINSDDEKNVIENVTTKNDATNTINVTNVTNMTNIPNITKSKTNYVSNYIKKDVAKFVAPEISFIKNGDFFENVLNKTKLNITGDYDTEKSKYIIDKQNLSIPDINLNTWNRYVYNTDITLTGLQGKQYVWVQVLGKDGQVYTSCSNYFEMLNTWTAPEVLFTKNGDTTENILNITKLNITGNYVDNSVKYIIDTQNLVAPTLNTWNVYTSNTDIILTGLQGKQYVWVQVLGKDGQVYTSCSNYFEMLNTWTAPEISFTKNGDTTENILNTTKLNVTGKYVDGSEKYTIDTQNLVAPTLNTWNVYTLNTDILLTGLQGKQYVWVQVLGKDGQVYTSCSNYFEMLNTWTAPEVSFTKNGDTTENILNTTKLNITGNYVDNSLKYVIDTQNLVAPTLNTWNVYTSNTDITLSGLQGKQYVWVQVLGKDGQVYTSCSNYFEMLENWPVVNTSIVAFGKSKAAARFGYDILLDDFVYTGYDISFEIVIDTPNLKLVEYAISMDGSKPQNYTVLSQYNKNLNTQTISYTKFFSMDKISNEKTGKIWFRVTDIHDQVTEMNVQQHIFSSILFN